MLEKIASALNVDCLDLFDKKSLELIDSDNLRKQIISSISEVINENFEKYTVIK